MGEYRLPPPVKLVIGLLGRDADILDRARAALGAWYGPEEEAMAYIPFTWTAYYAGEIGEHPLRGFVAYEPLLQRESLVDIKRRTNALEAELAEGGLRRVNLDPGYLTLGQFFLATTKDQRHRVYVRDGIFVEPTLYFESGAFHPFAWTYPDYRSREYRDWFARARSKLAYQRRHGGTPYSRRKSPPMAPPMSAP